MNIGERLREIRKSKNMTLGEIAKKINSSSGFLSDIENNKSVPSISKLEDICNALNISLETFFKNEDGGNLSSSEILMDIYNNISDEKELPLAAQIVKKMIDEDLINEDGTIPPKVQKLLLEAISLQSKLDHIKKG